jgi:hypothetical protein
MFKDEFLSDSGRHRVSDLVWSKHRGHRPECNLEKRHLLCAMTPIVRQHRELITAQVITKLDNACTHDTAKPL